MTGVLVISRLGSTRLNNKHLIESGGKTFIEWLLLRLQTKFEKLIKEDKLKLILLTSENPENRKFEEVVGHLKVEVFYGSDENIPFRQLQCVDEHNLNNIISIDGDDILCSSEAAYKIYQLFEGEPEVKYAKTVGLPLGMNVAGFRADYLRKSISEIEDEKLETGWGRIFNEDDCVTINMDAGSKNRKLRFTLDYKEDAQFFKEIITELGSGTLHISDDDLIALVEEKKLYNINGSLSEEYWRNFDQQILNEKKG